jgi:hypothetical protein
MSEDEIIVMVIAMGFGITSALSTRISSLPPAVTRDNPGIGLMRLAVAASLIWAAVVIHYFGDESIRGIYVVFYLIMAYAVAKFFGQILGALIFGLHFRSDVFERKNLAAAVFIAGFILATGIIFGGSLWGEADPVGSDEGGWWIPMGFFLMGWGILVAATALFLWREPGRFRRQIRQERDAAMALSTAVYMISSAFVILEGVAGDFWGWRHGLLGMGTIAVMLVGHEIFITVTGSGDRPGETPVVRRFLERCFYIGLAVGAWSLNRLININLGGG